MFEPSHIYQVSDLNLAAKSLLNTHFGTVIVTGEISNLSRPSSGHLYFSLKDSSAQIRCALFRFQHQKAGFKLENGQEVTLHAQVTLYEARGDYQLIVSKIDLAGAGKLQAAFDALKRKLEKAGLFDESKKQLIPTLPHHIGIVSSPSGAALQDILKVLQRRFPAIPVTVYPTPVQGVTAAPKIASAIEKANQEKACDVLIIARGGGSLEDLWAFNEEIVAQAIYQSKLPIVTGIGHQTDFTIADFVSDYRAATPSAAAETVTPDQSDYAAQLARQKKQLHHLIQSTLKHHQLDLSHLKKRLQHPTDRLKQQAQRLDQHEITLHKSFALLLEKKKLSIKSCMQQLHTLSPLNTLQRGYSITSKQATGKVITHKNEIKTGEIILTQLAEGTIESVVQPASS